MSISKLHATTRDKKYLKVQIPQWLTTHMNLKNKDSIMWQTETRIDIDGKKYQVAMFTKAESQPETQEPT